MPEEKSLKKSEKGRFGKFGGQFVNEMLMPALLELEEEFERLSQDSDFQNKFEDLLRNFGGRPTPLYHAEKFSELVGCKVYLKREDLLYGGSHKLNNTLGQALLAKKMGKSRLITETAAGMHGVATTIAGDVCGLEVEVFMGVHDIERQPSNVRRMELLGAEITPVDIGGGVLKDAVSDTLREWASCSDTTHYLMGSTVGPHPFPEIVANFQSVIGEEIKKQILEAEGKLPDAIVACGSGGSNALGAFKPFINEEVRFYFVEGGGEHLDADNSAAAFQLGSPGVIHGALMYTLQDEDGQIKPSKTRSAGLNYPARGPELSHLYETGRMNASYAFDDEVFEAVKTMAETEGLIPALETAHAIAYTLNHKDEFEEEDVIVLNYSGRGDKDLETILRYFEDED
ncbi:tryptophan synthase subunit beta [candidate division MSBL1 archaeon SCGC-AAA382F02]|uniref:Tryptophan synthase beta chain n=1 Tax=candidate division MSBL1 archaeon SCGC-AAA382F02 TaxID=1698282 RepID=A0A133VHU9_9EURY|nr:tryptophan synthase subunit beta [candidate division MSBL1 archaeon SCGC-AAA382F02]